MFYEVNEKCNGNIKSTLISIDWSIQQSVTSSIVAIPPLSTCYASFHACWDTLTCTLLCWSTLHLQLFYTLISIIQILCGSLFLL